MAILLTTAAICVHCALKASAGTSSHFSVVLLAAASLAAARYDGFRAGHLSMAAGGLVIATLIFEPGQLLNGDRPEDLAALLSLFVISLVGCWLWRMATAESDGNNRLKPSSPNRNDGRPRLWTLIGFILANFAAAGLGEGLKLIPGLSIVFWPPSGIFVAALLLNPRRSWPWWVAGACIAEMAGNVLWFHNPFHLALLYFASNAAEAMTAALLVSRLLAGTRGVVSPQQLEAPRNAVMFALLAGGLAPLVGATIIATVDAILGKHEFWTAFRFVWLGDGTGLLFSAPLTLAAVQAWRRRRRITMERSAEFVATCGIAVLVAWLALLGRLPTVYMVLPAIVWSAVRFQVRGAAVTLAGVVLTVAAFTRSGHGEFIADAEHLHPQAIALQVFLGVSASTALIVAGLSAQYVRALAKLQAANRYLERRVDARTAALHESRERLRLAVEATGVAIYEYDPSTRRQTFSEEAMRLWGFEPGAEPPPEKLLDHVHPDDRQLVQSVAFGSLDPESSGRFAIEHRLVRSDGTIRWVASYGHTVFSSESGERKAVRLVGTLLDITERKQAEEQLKEADRNKDAFLATLAHELRNPLAPIRNGLQILRKAKGNAQVVEQSLSIMARQSDQMTRLIDDLMELSRVRQGRIVLQKSRLDLADAVRDAVDACRPMIDERRHQLRLGLPGEPAFVDGDFTRLSQVFANLLNNAAKYTPTGGRIDLFVERGDGEVQVAIRDDGQGIPAEMLASVFDMFIQVESRLDRSQGGLGIGLNIVRRLVEMHGGAVVAESRGRGLGSTFTVRLPLASSAAEELPAPDRTIRPVSSERRRRILVVDDNRDSAESLAMMLEAMGNETRTAYDGVEAVAAAEEFRADVILMDVGMPRMNGYDACRQIREQPWGRETFIVAQSGWGQLEDKRKAFESGFDRHLTKPIDPDELERTLAETRSAGL